MTMKTRHDTRRGANTAAGQALSRRRLLQMGATAGGLAATVPLLSACGGSSTQSGSSGSTSSKTGTLLAWTYFDQAKIAASQFMKSHPGIKVNMQVFPGNNYETKLRLALSTDQSPPDLFDMDADYLGKYINTFPEDLTSYGVDNLVSGSQVLAYRIPYGYSSPGPGLAMHVEAAVERLPAGEPELMVFYGVGNHGGGPARA